MSHWMFLDTPATVTYPGKDMSAQATAFTTTAEDSATKDAVWTEILSIQVGAGHLSGTLLFETHGGDDVRSISTPTSATNNLSANYSDVKFIIPGGFRVSTTSGSATCRLYIQYRYATRQIA